MKPAIEVKNLTRTFDYYRKEPGLLGGLKNIFYRKKLFADAVKDVNFSIAEGELVGFIGPNGAGKTTTLKMLSGILHPTSGTARVLGFVPWQRETLFQQQISLVMGNKQQLWWDLPAQDTFLVNQQIYQIPEAKFKKTMTELTQMLQIADIMDIQVRKLSLGQRMKAELALALLHEPKVLFLDEPTIGLDVISQKNIREFLLRFNRENKTTIILTSHYMDDIKELAERVITIDHGRIIYDGNLENLIKQYVDEKILKISFAEKIKRDALLGFGKLSFFEDNYAELIVTRGDAIKITAALIQKFPVDDLLVEEVEIEEAVRRIFEKGYKKEGFVL